MDIFFDWYLWYYVLLAFFGAVYSQQKRKFLETDEGIRLNTEEDYKSSVLFCILVFLPLILIAGFRDKWLAGDSGPYAISYEGLPSDLSTFLKDVDWESKSPGFQIFEVLFKQITGSDFRGLFIFIAVICGVCLAVGYRRYAADVVTCAFLFFASTDFSSWMMNGIRQFLVVSILFLVFPLVQKRKYLSFIIIVLILYTFHRSAILVLPLYLCSLGKPFNKRTLIVLLLCLVALLFVGQFTDLMNESLQGGAYENMVSEFKDDDGTNIFRVLVYSIPAFIAIIKRKEFNADTPSIINISVNMSLITSGLYFLSVPISGIFMGRLPIYFSLFNYILLPWELKHLFQEDMYKTLRYLMLGLYIVFYFIQLSIWNF